MSTTRGASHRLHVDNGRACPGRARPVGVRISAVVDLTDLPGERGEAELQRLLRAEARRRSTSAGTYLLRATLFRLDEANHVLLVVTHHIASDGWSVGVFCRELGECYEARRAGNSPVLPELPLQYRDFVQWQRRRLRGERLERSSRTGGRSSPVRPRPCSTCRRTGRATPVRRSKGPAGSRGPPTQTWPRASCGFCRDETGDALHASALGLRRASLPPHRPGRHPHRRALRQPCVAASSINSSASSPTPS